MSNKHNKGEGLTRPFGPGGSHMDLTSLDGNASVVTKITDPKSPVPPSPLLQVPPLQDSYLMDLFKSDGVRSAVIPPTPPSAAPSSDSNEARSPIPEGSPQATGTEGSAATGNGPPMRLSQRNLSKLPAPSVAPVHSLDTSSVGSSSGGGPNSYSNFYNAFGTSPTSARPIGHMRNRATNIRVATYNIFFELFDDPLVRNYANERLPLIVNELEALDADIIALQEVTPWFYGKLRSSSPMLREQYFWTRLPTEVEGTYSQVLLSRFPIIDAAFLNVNAKKRCLFALVFMHLSKTAATNPEDNVFIVTNLHLKSDYNSALGENKDVRSAQLKKIFAILRSPLPPPTAFAKSKEGRVFINFKDPAYPYSCATYPGIDGAVRRFEQIQNQNCNTKFYSIANSNNNTSGSDDVLALANLPAIVLGDFNQDEDETLHHMATIGAWDPAFRDIHLSTRSREDEKAGRVIHTYDSTKNNLLIHQQFPPVRFDRVLIRDFAPISSGSLRLFGTKPTRTFVPVSKNPQINKDAVLQREGGDEREEEEDLERQATATPRGAAPPHGIPSIPSVPSVSEVSPKVASPAGKAKGKKSSAAAAFPQAASTVGLDEEDVKLRAISRKETNAYDLDELAAVEEAAEGPDSTGVAGTPSSPSAPEIKHKEPEGEDRLEVALNDSFTKQGSSTGEYAGRWLVDLFPSDHFGVVCNIERSLKTPPSLALPPPSAFPFTNNNRLTGSFCSIASDLGDHSYLNSTAVSPTNSRAPSAASSAIHTPSLGPFGTSSPNNVFPSAPSQQKDKGSKKDKKEKKSKKQLHDEEMAAALHHPSRQHTADTLSPGLGPKQAPTMEMGDLFAADADGNGMMGSPTPSTDVTSGSVNSKPPLLNSAPKSGGQSVKLAAEAPTAPQSVNLHPVHVSFGTPVHSMEMMYHGGASVGGTTTSFGPTGESQDGEATNPSLMIHHTTQPPTPSPKVTAEKGHSPLRHHETRSHEQHQAPPVTQGIQMFPEAAAKSTEERRQVKTKFSPTTASPAATAGSFTDNLQPQTSSSRYRASALGIKEGSQAIGCTSSSSSDSDDDEKAQRKDAKRKSAKHHIRQPDGGLSRRRQHKGNVASSLYVDPVSGNAAPQSELLPIATEADGGDDLILGAVTQQPGSSATAESQPTGANLFKSFATALCVIPPPKLCSHIDIIRTSYDKAYTRWMPHLTILYPFVHPAKFADAIPLLQNALSKLPPFRVTLRKLAILNEDDPAAKKHVIYIVPEVKTECLMRLQAVVQKIFPQCVRPAMHGQEINADGFPQFRPHITVGQIPSNSPKERTEIFEWFKKHWQNQEFTVSQLHVVMENNTTSGANAAPASTGNAAGAYDSESRGSQSSESEGGSPQKKVSTGKGASDKKSRNNSPDRTPNIGPKKEEPATDATRRNRKGHRHNNTYISYDEIGDGAAEESNYESEGANKTRKEMKAEKRAKKSVSRHAAAANKKLTRPEKREGIFEVVHTVQLQGEADFMSTSAAQTPKPTPQAPPRMEDLMPLPDLELPPPTVTSDSKNDIKSSSNLLSASDVLKSIVSTSSGEAFPPLDSRSDGLQQSPVWGGVEHFPQVESTSTNPPAPSPNNTTFAAKPDDSLTAVTDGPAHSISGKSAAMSPHNEGQDRPTTVAATPSAGNLAAALSPSALVAAVANSSVLPMATGLASDSLLPLMVMEESRTTEVYEPTDALERWLATHSDRTLARAYPTHTSQKGGMYHISAIDMKGFMEEWQVALLASDAALAAKYGSAPRSAPSSASDNTGSSAAAAVPQPTAPIPFFIEEVRTKQYRLYVDIDMVVCGQSEEDGLGIGSDSLSTSQSPMLGSSAGSAAKTYLGVATAAAGVLPSPQASPQSTSLLANTTTSSSAGQTPTSGQPGDSPSTSTALSPSTTITSSYRDLLRQICIVTQQMFGVSDDDSAALVLYSHGPWPSTPKEPTIIAKTGYRLYFQRIFVDQPTHRRYLTRLAEVIRRTLGAVPPTCPQGTTWSDIIGDQCAVWDRTRLLGTVKLRRNLQRQYKYIGIFDSQHPESNGRNQELSQLYSKDVKRLMFGQMIRVWDANVRLPKPNNMLGAFNRTKAIPTTITNDAVSDDDSEPPALYLGPTEGSNKKGSKGGRPHGFFGIRKGSGCKRRGTLKPIESDEETHFLQQQRSDPRDDSASKACVVTPVVRPLKPSDPSKDVVVDNCFRMDRYFTALEGLERAAASSPTSPK